MVRVLSDDGAWLVLVDDIIRARFACIIEACEYARQWGW